MLKMKNACILQGLAQNLEFDKMGEIVCQMKLKMPSNI